MPGAASQLAQCLPFPVFASFGTMMLGGSRFEASGLRLPKVSDRKKTRPRLAAVAHCMAPGPFLVHSRISYSKATPSGSFSSNHVSAAS